MSVKNMAKLMLTPTRRPRSARRRVFKRKIATPSNKSAQSGPVCTEAWSTEEPHVWAENLGMV